MARLTKKQAYNLGYENGFTMASEDGSSEAPRDGWDSLLINAGPAFVKEKLGWDGQDSDGEATSLLDEYRKGCQAGADAACGGGEQDFPFATDGESGTIRAESFEGACEQLESMFTEEALADGAWGWVADQDNNRFTIGEVS